MPYREIFVSETVAVDAHPPGSVRVHEISALHHEALDDSMERTALVANGKVTPFIFPLATICEEDLHLPIMTPLTVQNWRQFSVVRGQTWSKSSILSRPAGMPPMDTSKKTTVFPLSNASRK